MEKTKVKIKVPATSANCGPGFDTLGIACSLYNEFTYELIPEGYELIVEGEGKDALEASKDNLAFASFYKLWDKVQGKNSGLKVTMKNNIPLSRGLGSSTAVIVAGIMAANFLSDSKLSKDELLALATEIEGHPDNVAPAIFGGFTISFMENNSAHTFKFLPKKEFTMVAVIPNMPLSTAKARAAIPKVVPHVDAVFNSSRSALLVASLLTGDFSLLHFAMEDKLHQPYRLPLIPGAKEALEAAKSAGAFGAIISGAGSTLMAYVEKNGPSAEVGKAMITKLKENGLEGKYVLLDIDKTGAQII